MNLDALLSPRPACLVAVAYAADGRPVAFARFAVCAAGGIYTLDVAPRGRHVSNGVAERLIVEIVGHARAHGAREVSLNFAGLRRVFDSRRSLARAGVALLRPLDRWVEIRPLNRFCAKFHPQWRARSLLLPSWWQFGWVAAAALRAELSAPPAATAGSAAWPAGDVDRLAGDERRVVAD
jgi:lysyl-tRNA synthetase class 2